MAAVVDSIVSFTVEKIGDLILEEASRLRGVRRELESIRKELRWMQSFLRDADRRLGDGDERVKTLVADVWSVARMVEDTVDTFGFREESQRENVSRWIDPVSLNPVSLRQIGERIEEIKKEIGNISARKSTYGIPEIDGGEGPSYVSRKLQGYRRAAAFADGDDVVGFAKDAQTLVERLIRGVAGDSRRYRRRVVSIVAPGGAGKTTLANRVCKSDHVKNHFDSTTWVCVSQTYKPLHLLQEIAGKVMGKQDEALKEKDLQEKLSEYLREKRYLIVLDDMWDTDAWDQLKAAFPDAKNGSRIILTTRNERLALYADPDPANPPYRLPLLNSDDSWKLFLKKAFPWEETGTEIPRPSSEELVEIGKQIVKKCGGLPLAISVVGGLLAAKGEAKAKDWRNVLVSLKAELSGESVHCTDIIALSYYDLPYHFKPCFLYFGLFPEDYEIDACGLKRLWIAEGFIQPKEGREKEDLAEDYLMELIGRSLVRVDKKDWDGSVISCRIHDLLHDFAISEGKKYKFLEICNKATASTPISTEAHWLALHHKAVVLSDSYSPNIRSVLSFKPCDGVNILHDLSKGLERLRVLEFAMAASLGRGMVPALIGKLSHLRYLSIQQYFLPPEFRYIGNIRNIHSIGNLYNLETLLLPKYGVRLPKEIWRLHRLKHLEARYCKFEGEPRVYNLKNLHTLKLGMGSWIEEEKTISSLDGLKILGLGLGSQFLSMEHLTEQLGSFICNLANLQSFEFYGSPSVKWQGISNLEQHLHLSVMLLGVKLEVLPKVPTTLTELVLSGSGINDDLMPTLEKLTNLRSLSLASDAYTGKKILTSAHGFPRLRYLLFYKLNQLEEWVVEGGAMPKLEKLKIKACRKLNKLSEGLGCITTLKKLCILDQSMELQNWLNSQPSIAQLVTMEAVWFSKWDCIR